MAGPLFFIRLTLADGAAAAAHMTGHEDWVERDFEDGVFLVSGRLSDGQGGAILASAPTRTAIKARLATDPFVLEGVVRAEIVAFKPTRLEPRPAFLAPD